jgi:branched-chain amino acid aminotransferase
MPEVVWCNGELLPAEAATVSAFDRGFTVGDGVFETLKAVDGVPFAMRRHLERLRHSLDAVGLDLPWSDDDLRGALLAVATTAPPVARVRITVTSGPAPLGHARGEPPPTVVIAAGEMAAVAPTAAVCTAPWPRNERGALAGVKSTSGGEAVRALAHATERGCSEALFATTTGLLCEGTATNVFVAVGGRLRTPPLAAGCLAGVTRALLLELVDTVEEDLPIEVLRTADEVLLTSTGRDVQPVHEVDGRPIAAPGPLTAAAAEAFAALVARDVDP